MIPPFKQQQVDTGTAFAVRFDKVTASQSRAAATAELVRYTREICENVNITMPPEYMIVPELVGDPKDPQLMVNFQILIKVSPWSEWAYFNLLKIPFLWKLVKGPRIVSYLTPSEYEMNCMDKAIQKRKDEWIK